MCLDCGCGQPGAVTIEGRKTEAGRHHAIEGYDHHHSHHDHPPEAGHGHADPRGGAAAKLLAWNDRLAAHNREHFRARETCAVNLISAPGSGKTALLEYIVSRWSGLVPLAVIEGDPETDADAQRIRQAGAPAIQINTGSACHLDADMVHRALHGFHLKPGTLLFIESVGNMVCPVLFDLGQKLMLAVIATTEGEDKPAKYRDLIQAADALLINKMDLLPHLDYAPDRALASARAIKPDLPVFFTSAQTGEGIEAFMQWLGSQAGIRFEQKADATKLR
jgi:hydrogenase nickel incorporation protein HypB